MTVSTTHAAFSQALDTLRTRLEEAGEDERRHAAAIREAVPPLLQSLPHHFAPPTWIQFVDRDAVLEAALAAETPEAALARLIEATEEPHAPPVITTQWSDQKVVPREWLVKGLLPADRMGIFTGPGGEGKSTLGLQLGACMAAGEKIWLPKGNADVTAGPRLMPLGPAPVVYWSAEDERAEFLRRLERLGMQNRVDGFLHFIDGAKRGPLWAPSAGGSRHTSTLGELTPAGAWIRRYAETAGARLLIVDSLAAAYACSEIDRGLVRAHCANWDWWGRESRCAVLFIAHPSKSGGYSGSTDWQAASRFMWSLGLQPIKPDDKSDGTAAPRLDDKKGNYRRACDAVHLWIERRERGLWTTGSAESAHHWFEGTATVDDPFAEDGEGE